MKRQATLSSDSTRKIISGVLILTLFFALGFNIKSARAEDSEATFIVNIPTTPVLQITLYDNDGSTLTGGSTMTVTPRFASAAFNMSNISIDVGTSNPAGYNLTMYAENTSLTSDTHTIPTLDTGSFSCTEAQSFANSPDCTFPVNRWGYKLLTSPAFVAIPTSTAPALLDSNTTPTNNSTTTVTFGARVNAQQPAGTYSTALTFVATVNPLPLP